VTTASATATAPAAPPVAPVTATKAVGTVSRRVPRLVGLAEHVVLAAAAFGPLLAVDRGIVTSDTKTYLYLDPTRFLSQVATMWNPTVALGTVTHEYIGYLLPMGPFYAGMSLAHVPTWVAQRLWLGGILFAAGAGVLYLCRVLNLKGPGRLVAALAFMLSPYFLQYAGRISVILLPWAGLPWMIVFTVLALRRGGWRYPAAFALVVAVVSGINATAILYVGVAPALWLIVATAVEREATWGRALATAGRIAVLTLACCLWWIAGLAVEAAYGVDVLRYTETVPSTSATSTPSEVIRGLGYWYFYGGDHLGPWTQSSVLYTQWLWLLASSFLVPVLAFCSAVLVRWRHRAYFVLLVLVGVVLSVGAYPYSSPTPLGGLLKAFMTDTTSGLALRSTDRATPLVVLGLAMLLGSGASALWRRLPSVGLVTSLVVAALVIANNPAMFTGDAQVASTFHQPATLPSYQLAAIDHLNATHQGTRVLAIPGNDFASYRWGNTVDTPQPAYLTRPFVTREQQIMGSEATADTLYAQDIGIQTGTEDWTGLAPMARLLDAGDLLVEYDQAYEHYGVPQPQILAQELTPTPAGLSDPVSFGTPVPNVATVSTLDEEDLATTPNPPWPSPLVDYTVDHPRPITRAESDTGAMVVAGTATGIQDLADEGMLDTTSAIYYSGTLQEDPSRLQTLMKQGAALVVTDTNRKQGFRWDTLTANYGETETPSENPAKHTPSDSPIELFPGTPLDTHSVASYLGAVDVTASSYGNSISYTPEDRPYAAVDNNANTSWQTGAFVPDPSGQWWQIRYPQAAPADQVTLTQPLKGNLTRWITKVTLTFDGGHPLTESLTAASRQPGGQTITFPPRSFRTLRITIDATSNDQAAPADAVAVGFSSVAVPGRQVEEVVKMPSDLLTKAGAASLGNRLTLSMARERVSSYPPRSDPETTISRQFTLPTARTFTLSGAASISSLLPDDQVDRLVGVPGSTGSGVVAYSNGRLNGDLKSGAEAAIDGNPATAWQPGFGAAHQVGDWLEYNLEKTLTFSSMTLRVLADGRHSVPTSLEVSATGPTGVVTTHQVTLPPISDSSVAGATTTVPIRFPAVTGRRIRVTVTGARLEYTTNYTVTKPTALPLGIATLGIPGLVAPSMPSTVPGTCQSNLISIDGKPVTVQITGSTDTALDNGDLSIEPCGADAHGISLAAGTHVLETQLADTPAAPSTVHCQATADCRGWNVDHLTLDSAPGGGPEPSTAAGSPPSTQPGPVPSVSAHSGGPTAETVSVKGAGSPFELVLGQSVSAGWQAVAHPAAGAPAGSRDVDLGESQLIDAFANGWPVTASELSAVGATGSGGTGAFTVTLTWTPQSKVWLAIGLSGVGVALCLLLAFLPTRWRRAIGGGTRRAWRWTTRWFRRSPRPEPRHARGRAAPEVALATAVPVLAAVADGHADDSPQLALPFANRDHRPPWWAVVLVAVIAGGVAAAISYPLVGLAAGMAIAAALVVPQARVVTSLVAVGLLVAAAVTVVHGQAFHPVPESSNWPGTYASAGVLVWMAVVFLAADAVVEASRRVAARRLRRRTLRSAERTPTPTPPESPGPSPAT
jgi:arabinofuranan 3-O-arabinosyltransferase